MARWGGVSAGRPRFPRPMKSFDSRAARASANLGSRMSPIEHVPFPATFSVAAPQPTSRPDSLSARSAIGRHATQSGRARPRFVRRGRSLAPRKPATKIFGPRHGVGCIRASIRGDQTEIPAYSGCSQPGMWLPAPPQIRSRIASDVGDVLLAGEPLCRAGVNIIAPPAGGPGRGEAG